MRNVTVQGLRARKVRLLLSALAVVLGVALVTGAFVLTDTLRDSFRQAFRTAAVDVDLVVRAAEPSGAEGVQRERISDSVVDVVRTVDGVAAADGVVQGVAKLQDRDGEIIQRGIAPTVGISWPTVEGLGPLRLVDDGVSRAPEGPGEVVVDVATAVEHDFEVGEEIGVQLGSRPVLPMTMVGRFGIGEGVDLAGATFAAFDLPVAQEGLDALGAIDVVNVRAAPGVDLDELGGALGEVLGFGYEVVDPELAADDLGAPLREGLDLLERVLLAFSAVGVFVGGFVIFNTFSMLVSQRTRELGLLRALGATRRQVVVGVLVEATVVGAVAAAVGLVAGTALVRVLLAVFPDVGFDVPDGPVVLGARTVVVALAVGIGVTALSALVPARRAAKVAPVAAIGHESRALTVPSLFRRTVVGFAVIIVGLAAVAVGHRGAWDDVRIDVGIVALGCFVAFLGLVVAAPALGRVFAGVLATRVGTIAAAVLGAGVALGGLLRVASFIRDERLVAAGFALLVAAAGAGLLTVVPSLRGVLGRLARGNATRNPRRTTATASALVVGLGLVFVVAIVASSIRHSLQSGIESGVHADVVLSADQFAPISRSAVQHAASLPGVVAHAQLSFGSAGVEGATTLVTGVNPEGFAAVIDPDLRAGSVGDFVEGALVSSVVAERHDLSVGDPLSISFSRLGPLTFPVTGIYENRSFTGSVLVDVVVSDDVYVAGFGPAAPATLAFLATAPGAGPEARAEIEAALGASFPDIRVQSVPEFQAEQNRSIDLIVNVLLALLVFSLVIAVLGIVNTLLLSVHERTRELGLLRTVGMSALQTRRMVRGEAVIIAAIGTALGVLVGVFWGWAFTSALADEGVSRLSVPLGSLGVFVVLAAAAGVVASLLPAWRAAHLDVLEALAEE